LVARVGGDASCSVAPCPFGALFYEAAYTWDVLNRMTSYTSGSIATSYEYRADGMRVSKSDSTGSAVYRYDGRPEKHPLADSTSTRAKTLIQPP
jgi:uncharacterized protein RhaS with RHS repeats